MFSERIIDERTVNLSKEEFLKNTVKPLKAVFMVDQKRSYLGGQRQNRKTLPSPRKIRT